MLTAILLVEVLLVFLLTNGFIQNFLTRVNLAEVFESPDGGVQDVDRDNENRFERNLNEAMNARVRARGNYWLFLKKICS